jgi:hypothetical protein
MDTLNKEFASLHSLSTALNLVSLGGVAFHGLVRRSFCFFSLFLAAAAAVTLLIGSTLLALPMMTRAYSIILGSGYVGQADGRRSPLLLTDCSGYLVSTNGSWVVWLQKQRSIDLGKQRLVAAKLVFNFYPRA